MTLFSATGGVITTDGDYTVHVFTADDNLVVTGTIPSARVLRVGAGAGGASGGGAAGEAKETTEDLSGSIPVTIGTGGAGVAQSASAGVSGGDTVFNGATAKGGGGGGKLATVGVDGGCGGGGGADSGGIHAGGAATGTGAGYAGGTTGSTANPYPAGGGGGAGGAGGNGSTTGGNGGPGITSDIVTAGVDVDYAGGGAGATFLAGTPGTATHGGGNANDNGGNGSNGTANTGAGGGGAGNGRTGGDGADGILVVRYLTPVTPPPADKNPLLDGNLSLMVGGVEYEGSRKYTITDCQDAAPGGDASLAFTLHDVDPFTISSDYPELVTDAAVVFTHDGHSIFSGQICSDPSIGAAGDTAYVDVECDGLIGKAKRRDDYFRMWADRAYDAWQVHRATYSGFSVDTDGRIYISVPKGLEMNDPLAGHGGVVFYYPYMGIADVDIDWIEFHWDANLGAAPPAQWSAALLYSTAYSDDWENDFTSYVFAMGQIGGGPQSGDFTHTFPAGTHLVGLCLEAPMETGTDSERYLQITDLVIGQGSAPRVDEVMTEIASGDGLAIASDTEAIGSLVWEAIIRTPMTRADALVQIAAQSGVQIDWRFVGTTFYCHPMPSVPATIRALSNCYLIDAETPGITYDVHHQPETEPEYVLVLFACSGIAPYPDGAVCGCHRPTSPPSASSRVLTLDYSGETMTWAQAQARGDQALAWYSDQPTGPITIATATVPKEIGGTQLAAYIRAGDWIEEVHVKALDPDHSLHYITGRNLDVDSGVVTLDIGGRGSDFAPVIPSAKPTFTLPAGPTPFMVERSWNGLNAGAYYRKKRKPTRYDHPRR